VACRFGESRPLFSDNLKQLTLALPAVQCKSLKQDRADSMPGTVWRVSRHRWYGPRPPGAGYDRPLAASMENCHADRSHWLGSGKICLRDSWRRCAGKTVVRETLRRHAVSAFFANLPPCRVGMKASNSAHFWPPTLSDLGHDVRLISPQFVTPYVKSNKNDWNDAEAICEAVGRAMAESG
jgi:hypothetical protein